MGKVIPWACVLVGCWVLGTDNLQAQDAEDGPSCWWEYASCARQSQGDAQWRSICYAGFLQLYRNNEAAGVSGNTHCGRLFCHTRQNAMPLPPVMSG